MTGSPYLRPAVSNGHPGEQQLIRQWWYEQHEAKGALVWEYYLEGCYLDAIWFPDAEGNGVEFPGLKAPITFPIAGKRIVICEAKLRLTPELIGQALVYGAFAKRRGADIQSIVVFAATGSDSMRAAATALGLQVVMTGPP